MKPVTHLIFFRIVNFINMVVVSNCQVGHSDLTMQFILGDIDEKSGNQKMCVPLQPRSRF